MIINNIKKAYSNRELFFDFELKIDKGLLEISGDSGSGKTTLINIITGLVTPDTGNIILNNNDSFSYCGQDSTLFGYYSLRENLREFKIEYKEDELNGYLKLFNISNLFDSKIYKLSGGERQKAEIVFALLRKATIYIFDEPFSSIDKESKIKLVNIINDLAKDNIVILINHDENINGINIEHEINLTTKKINHFIDNETKDIKLSNDKSKNNININSFFWFIRSYLKEFKLDFFIKEVLIILSAFFITYGIATVNFNSLSENIITSVKNDPFMSHSLKFKAAENVDVSFFSEFESSDNSYEYIEGSFNNNQIVFVEQNNRNDDKCFYLSSSSIITENQKLSFGHYVYDLTSIDSPSSIDFNASNIDIKSIIDGYYKDSCLIFTPNKFIDRLFINGGLSSISFSKDSNLKSDELLFGYSYNGERLIDTSFDPIEFVEKDGYYLSIKGCPKGKSIDVYSYSNHYNAIDKIVTTDDGTNNKNNIKMSVLTFKEIILHKDTSEKYKIAVDNNFIYSNISKYGFSVNDVILSNNNEITKCILYIGLGLSCALGFVLFSYYSYKGKSKWFSELKSIYNRNSLSTHVFKRDAFIGNSISKIAYVLLSIIPYIYICLPLVNYINMCEKYSITRVEGYYYYSMQPRNPYYDGILSPIQFNTFSWMFLVVPLMIILLFIYEQYLINKQINKIR